MYYVIRKGTCLINKYKIKPTQDEADAICIGYHALNRGFDWS